MSNKVMNLMSHGTNARNVEIKTKLDNADAMIELLQTKTNQKGVIIQQKDTYYKINEGKLKMRKFENCVNDLAAELIFYKRPNDARPKLCSYRKIGLNQQMYEDLHEVLHAALGVEVTVIKKRLLFHIRNTRVHIDDVQSLGTFLELETVLQSNETEEDGLTEIKKIMNDLGINNNTILAQGYLELLTDLTEQEKKEIAP